MSEIFFEDYQLDSDRVQEVLFKDRLKQLSRKKKILGILGIALILAAVGTGVCYWQGANNQSGFLTAAVTRSTITDYIEATGTLEPVKKSEMGFKNDGTIILLNVQPGDRVKQGQVLAEQDSTTLKATLDQAQSSLVQDEINLQTITINCDSNRKTLEQQERLFDAGVASELERDTAQRNLHKSELEVASAEAKLANDRAKVEQAQSDLNGATLVAPFDGIIGAVNGQVGQLNGMNASSSTLLTVMSEDLQLSALVNEADIGRIKVGQDVEFTSNAYSDRVFKGKVLRVTPEAQTVSSVQYYPVLISCIDLERQLFSGMSVSSKIVVVRENDVLTVPMIAVSFAETYAKTHSELRNTRSSAGSASRRDAQGGLPTNVANNGQRGMVLVLQNEGPVIKPVLLGLSNGSVYQVVEGLKEGDQVVIGSNRVDTNSNGSGSSNSNNAYSGRQNQRGGSMMQGPPPGF